MSQGSEKPKDVDPPKFKCFRPRPVISDEQMEEYKKSQPELMQDQMLCYLDEIGEELDFAAQNLARLRILVKNIHEKS
jgi:hypothetical protein